MNEGNMNDGNFTYQAWRMTYRAMRQERAAANCLSRWFATCVPQFWWTLQCQCPTVFSLPEISSSDPRYSACESHPLCMERRVRLVFVKRDGRGYNLMFSKDLWGFDTGLLPLPANTVPHLVSVRPETLFPVGRPPAQAQMNKTCERRISPLCSVTLHSTTTIEVSPPPQVMQSSWNP